MSKIRKKLNKIIANKTKELEEVELEIDKATRYNHNLYRDREAGVRDADFADVTCIPHYKKHDVYKSFFDEVVDLVGGRIEYITISSVGEEIE